MGRTRITVTEGKHKVIISSKHDVDASYLDVRDLGETETPTADEIAAMVKALAAQGGDTKRVHCESGVNRSPMIATLYLWLKTGKSLRTVYDQVSAAYRAEHLNLSEKVWETLRATMLDDAMPALDLAVAGEKRRSRRLSTGTVDIDRLVGDLTKDQATKFAAKLT